MRVRSCLDCWGFFHTFSPFPSIFHFSCKGSILISAPWEKKNQLSRRTVSVLDFSHYHLQNVPRRPGFHQEMLQGFEQCESTWEANDLLCWKSVTYKESLRSKLLAVYTLCLMKTWGKFFRTVYDLVLPQVKVTEKGSGVLKRFLIRCVPPCPLTIGRQCHRSMHTLTIKLSFLWLPSLSLFFFLLLFIFSHHCDFSLCDKQSYQWSELVCAEHSVTEPSRFLAQGTVFTLWTVKQLLFSLLWPLSPFINRFSQQMALEVLCWIH